MQPILRINLSSRRVEEYKIPEKWEREFLGGASLAVRLLYPYLTEELDPFSPEAPLLFLNGPLTGTSGPTVGRFVVCGKGPATGLWAESNCGGFWGPELRACGYDGLWITGASPEPLYLWLEGGRLEFRPAAHLWGRETYETQDLIKQELQEKRAHVAVIGSAAEHRVLFAGIFCDHGRTAGRTGLGAVMGSKNLKGIALRGTQPLPLANPAAYAPLRSESNRTLKQDNEARVLHEMGTASAANYSEYLGAMPARYYHQGGFEQVDQISGATMQEQILAGTSACHACVIACGRVVRLEDGAKRKGPEYETICSFGPNLLISDLKEIVRLGETCDRYGMDTISAGNTIGLAFHLYEEGLITAADTGGLELIWGDIAVVRELLEQTASGTGFGAWIGQGSRRLGARFGAVEEAVQVNGLEVAYHDPRGVSGMALVYATSPRGACHNQSDYFFVDWGHTESNLGIEYFSRHAGAEKSANVARHQDWRTVYNSMVMCIFANVQPQMQVDLINAACSYRWSVDDMMRAGERGWNLKRAVNNRLGLTAQNDRLPKALMEPYPAGGTEGYVPDLEGMLFTYYAVRGWDETTGYPTRDKLVSLGLDDIAEDLWG
ncbi:MAG TPA: aldehyde ferredoxin oxidoreductase family protein [Anaerolineales bacterium]|nr:aldehyde ferredoxin oxidoreductase family protein [Anaerolineales bacterium]